MDILGHIFEQSITELERLRHGLESGGLPVDDGQATTRRKKEGAFYTPAFITRYNVEQALGGDWKARFEALRAQHEAAATGTARKALADPNAYDLNALNEPQRKALIRFWEAWQEELKILRILDPACGSGAFLIEDFDQLHALCEVSNARLEELRGQRTLFDLDRQILQHNLSRVTLARRCEGFFPQMRRWNPWWTSANHRLRRTRFPPLHFQYFTHFNTQIFMDKRKDLLSVVPFRLKRRQIGGPIQCSAEDEDDAPRYRLP